MALKGGYVPLWSAEAYLYMCNAFYHRQDQVLKIFWWFWATTANDQCRGNTFAWIYPWL